MKLFAKFTRKFIKPVTDLYDIESYWFDFIFYFIVSSFLIIYLLNPTLGIVEFIPDFLPLVGNIDELIATLLLIRYGRIFLILLSKKPTTKNFDARIAGDESIEIKPNDDAIELNFSKGD